MFAHKFIRSLLCVVPLLAFVACTDVSPSTPNTTANTDTVLRWGSDENGGAPFLYRDPKDPSKRLGFEKEIAEEIGKRLGRKIEFVQTAWDSLIPALNRRDFDFILSGVEITPERETQVNFTEPYYITTKQLVVRAGDSTINSLADLKDRPVGTLMESTSEKYLEKGLYQVRSYEDAQRPFDDLLNGTIDAVFIDLPIAEFYARSNRQLRFAGKAVAPGKYAIAIRKEDEDLRKTLNSTLKSMTEDGTLQRILEKCNLWNDMQTTASTDAAR